MEARYECGGYLTIGYPPGAIYRVVVLMFLLGLLCLFVTVIRQSKKSHNTYEPPVCQGAKTS